MVINDTAIAAAAMVMKQSGKKDQAEVEFARCECRGLKEEYTAAYIAGVRERYGGRWICGLCAEAVKEEEEMTGRSKKRDDDDDDMMMMSTDGALNRHMKFCEQFRSSSPPTRPAQDLISAMKHVLRRSLDSSPRNNKSTSTSFLAC